MKKIERVIVCGVDSKNSLNFKCLKSAFKKFGVEVPLSAFDISLNSFVDFINLVKIKDSTLLVLEPEFHESIVPILDCSNTNIKNSGICDIAYTLEGKVYGDLSIAKRIDFLISCGVVELCGKSILLFGAGTVASAILPSLGKFRAKRVVIVDKFIERAAEVLERNSIYLAEVECEILDNVDGDFRLDEYEIAINSKNTHSKEPGIDLSKDCYKSLEVIIDFLDERLFLQENDKESVTKVEWTVLNSFYIVESFFGVDVSCKEFPLMTTLLK